jgi:hypothetical protein
VRELPLGVRHLLFEGRACAADTSLQPHAKRDGCKRSFGCTIDPDQLVSRAKNLNIDTH